MIIQKIRQFMYGRYGFDSFGLALIVIYLIVSFINLFVLSWVLYIAELLLLVYAFFRAFSKNIPARQRENAVYLKVWSKIKAFFSKIKQTFSKSKSSSTGTKQTDYTERDVYKFRTCPSCSATLRLPNKPGKHTTKCPRCGKEFEVNI